MSREVCFFDKFSYCKNGDMTEKRHPNPCKTFMLKGFCRFEPSCKYSHRLSKRLKNKIRKLNLLKKLPNRCQSRLLIKMKKLRLLKGIYLTLKVENWKIYNIKSAIRTVEEELLMEVEENDDGGKEQIHVGVEEAVGHEVIWEAETIKKGTIEYVQKCLPHLEKLHLELNKTKYFRLRWYDKV